MSWKNTNIMPHVGISTRMFVTDWLSLSIGLRDYMFSDKFEPRDRDNHVFVNADKSTTIRPMTLQEAKDNPDKRFTYNVMVCGSIAIYLPFSFQYKTPR
jgi:hypothetical protein